MQGLNRMDEDNKTRLDLETALTNTINLLDLRKPYSKEFYASIEEAEKCIQEEIYEKWAAGTKLWQRASATPTLMWHGCGRSTRFARNPAEALQRY